MKLIGEDKQADLALLKIVKPPAGLVPVKLGEISSVQVAEDIHIIGHPHGQLWSYSSGVVSQIRDNYDWKYADGSEHLAKVLQMQTAINPGNSGGPVVDNNSSMLGLVAMSEEGQNLNYAVAIDVIKGFVNRAMTSQSRGPDSNNRTQTEFVGLASDSFRRPLFDAERFQIGVYGGTNCDTRSGGLCSSLILGKNEALCFLCNMAAELVKKGKS
jgi:S1-C subfamily serine protease